MTIPPITMPIPNEPMTGSEGTGDDGLEGMRSTLSRKRNPDSTSTGPKIHFFTCMTLHNSGFAWTYPSQCKPSSLNCQGP